MKTESGPVKRIKTLYKQSKSRITERLQEFSSLWKKSTDEDIFRELAFCLLTPQSKAKSCWEAICRLDNEDLLLKGECCNIRPVLQKHVRFHNKKADYLVGARELFSKDGKLIIRKILNSFADAHERREWLVINLKGLGYKEAGHFLRNIGFGENIAILDRHILRNLHALRVIDEMPSSLSRKKYLEIEQRMRTFAERIEIPLAHLDLLFWSKETGEIFK